MSLPELFAWKWSRRLAAVALFAGLALALGAEPLRNVLLIVVDDLNLSLGCYGAPVKSPNIDRLAARGTRFARAYCQYPLCNPSRVSFLTGRRPETSGVYALNTSSRKALPDAVSLPGYFRGQGYLTQGAGKIFHNPQMNDPSAWDRYEDGQGDDAQEQAAIKARYGGGDGRPSWTVLDGDGSRTRDGLNARTIVRSIGEATAARRPFFLAAGFHKPHLPWTAPKQFFDLYPESGPTLPAEPAMRDVPVIAIQTELTGFAQPDSRALAVRGYYACVSFTDAQIGLLVSELDRLSLWDTTVVALLGDNGFHLGDHGGLWAKLSAFNASTNVPFILAGAGVPRGRVVTSTVELLDLYPTVVELAGLSPPAGLEGETLVPLMEGRAKNRRPASSLVFHYDAARGIDILGRSVISEEWRYTEWADGREGREFYWRAGDPGEYANQVATPRFADAVHVGEKFLQEAPPLKPGTAGRPRALLPQKKRAK